MGISESIAKKIVCRCSRPHEGEIIPGTQCVLRAAETSCFPRTTLRVAAHVYWGMKRAVRDFVIEGVTSARLSPHA